MGGWICSCHGAASDQGGSLRDRRGDHRRAPPRRDRGGLAVPRGAAGKRVPDPGVVHRELRGGGGGGGGGCGRQPWRRDLGLERDRPRQRGCRRRLVAGDDVGRPAVACGGLLPSDDPAVHPAADELGDLPGESQPHFRSQLGRKLRALERNHEVRFPRTQTAPELASDLETFIRLHDARWESRGGSTSASERTRKFHADVTAAALERGWLCLWPMEVDGHSVAAWYGR
jgi:Acetyltransferase (GNAT) domain